MFCSACQIRLSPSTTVSSDRRIWLKKKRELDRVRRTYATNLESIDTVRLLSSRRLLTLRLTHQIFVLVQS